MVYCICAFALYYNYIYKLWSRGAYKVRRTFRASLENNLKEESISALSPYLVTTCTGIFNNQVTGTDKGSYILLQNSKGEYNIFYVDYLTSRN